MRHASSAEHVSLRVKECTSRATKAGSVVLYGEAGVLRLQSHILQGWRQLFL
jgi:hypothetical protein